MMQMLQALVIVGAVCGTLYVLWRPHWVFVLIISMFPMEQLLQVYIGAFSTHRTWFNYIVGTLSVLAVVFRMSRREPILLGFRNPITTLVAVLYVLWAVGVLYSPARDVAIDSFRQGIPYIGLLLLFLPLLVVDIFEFRQLLSGMMFLGSVIAVLVIANPNSTYYSGRLFLDLGMLAGVDRYGSPLALGEMGGMIAMIAVLVRPNKAAAIYTLLRIGAFVSGMGLAIGSGSRGQVLAAAITGILFYPMARKIANPRQFFLGAVGLGIVVLGLYVVFKLFIGAQNEQRWNAIGMLRDTTVRLTMVTELLNAYIASPGHWLLGLGTNAYAAISSNHNIIYVHNVVAEILCEHGIVGAILFAAISVLTFKYGRRLWMLYRDDPSMRATVAVLLACCVYALFLALKQGSISYPAPFFWWMVLAKLHKHEERILVESGAPEHHTELQSLEPRKPRHPPNPRNPSTRRRVTTRWGIEGMPLIHRELKIAPILPGRYDPSRSR